MQDARVGPRIADGMEDMAIKESRQYQNQVGCSLDYTDSVERHIPERRRGGDEDDSEACEQEWTWARRHIKEGAVQKQGRPEDDFSWRIREDNRSKLGHGQAILERLETAGCGGPDSPNDAAVDRREDTLTAAFFGAPVSETAQEAPHVPTRVMKHRG